MIYAATLLLALHRPFLFASPTAPSSSDVYPPSPFELAVQMTQSASVTIRAPRRVQAIARVSGGLINRTRRKLARIQYRRRSSRLEIETPRLRSKYDSTILHSVNARLGQRFVYRQRSIHAFARSLFGSRSHERHCVHKRRSNSPFRFAEGSISIPAIRQLQPPVEDCPVDRMMSHAR